MWANTRAKKAVRAQTRRKAPLQGRPRLWRTAMTATLYRTSAFARNPALSNVPAPPPAIARARRSRSPGPGGPPARGAGIGADVEDQRRRAGRSTNPHTIPRSRAAVQHRLEELLGRGVGREDRIDRTLGELAARGENPSPAKEGPRASAPRWSSLPDPDPFESIGSGNRPRGSSSSRRPRTSRRPIAVGR